MTLKQIFPSKNQNPREGIETDNYPTALFFVKRDHPSKNQNPREGIETCKQCMQHSRNLKRIFKKPKSPRGD